MLISRDRIICALLSAIVLPLSVSESQAAIFDFLRPKQSATARRSETAAPRGQLLARRGQSPDPAYSAPAIQAPAAQPTSTYASFQPSYCYTLPNGWGHDKCYCFNCGECDQYQSWLKNRRARWHETWYPRVAPYCQASWGWTQPCWRRMSDNYNCPPLEKPAKKSPPAMPPRAIPEPDSVPPEPPDVPNASNSRRFPGSVSNRASGFVPATNAASERQAASVQSESTRFTGLADTLESEQDAEDAVDQADDTLESQMEAADSEADLSESGDDSLPPAIDD